MLSDVKPILAPSISVLIWNGIRSCPRQKMMMHRTLHFQCWKERNTCNDCSLIWFDSCGCLIIEDDVVWHRCWKEHLGKRRRETKIERIVHNVLYIKMCRRCFQGCSKIIFILMIIMGPILQRVDINRNLFVIDINKNYLHKRWETANDRRTCDRNSL